MAQIGIRRPHTLTLAQARKEADVLAEHLKQEFDLESRWSGNKLSFKRRGVDGVMTVSGKDVHVAAELGFLVSLLKPKIEARLNAHFDDVFGKEGAAGAKPAAARDKAGAAHKGPKGTAQPKAVKVAKAATGPAAKKAAGRPKR